MLFHDEGEFGDANAHTEPAKSQVVDEMMHTSWVAR
jgi:hypothetical protein